MIKNATTPKWLPNQFLVAFSLLLIFVAGCNAKAPEVANKQEAVVTETAETTETQAANTDAVTQAEESQAVEDKAAEDKTNPAAESKDAAEASATPNESDKTKPTGEKMSAHPIVKMVTSKGTMTIELDAEKAPKSVENFISYVESGFYDGLIFHRVIPNFMVQGGGMNPDMSEKKNNAPIKNEANNGLKNDRGTLAMARTNDPNSATSQFFINLKDNDFLNFTSETPAGWGYAVFGKVTDGLEIIDEIAKVKTGNHGYHGDVPLEPVLIEKMTLEK